MARRQPRHNRTKRPSLSYREPLCANSAYLLVALTLLVYAAAAQAQTRPPKAPHERLRYQIRLALDFENRAYAGTQRVRWINRGDHPTSIVFFHLYPNLRVPGYVPPTDKTESGQHISDEPRLEVTEIRSATNEVALPFSLDDQETLLRVNLREAVQPNAAVEIVLKFKGSVPEIDPDETGLVMHVMQQVSAAVRSTRELRRPRDINFRCRGVIFLSSFYPVLAARDGDDWYRKVEPSIGDTAMSDPADYEVSIESAANLNLYASGAARKDQKTPGKSSEFVAENLRDFAIVAGSNLRSEERTVGNVTVRSIFRPDHEVVGRRVMNIAADAARVYSERIGQLPISTVSIVDVPLVATLNSAAFSGLGTIASAFYLDFDSPSMSNMPDVIREQRASVEDSLEWTVAAIVAHQWWGGSVGNDPGREPVLDEALANWSALLYYREAHGEERATVALEEQLRGVYKLYRTFGGEDMEANRSARDYRNSFQYAAIVASKGALMFEALRKLLGNDRFFAALRGYYAANLLEVAELDDLRGAFVAEAHLEQRRTVSRTFDRWLSDKRGDEDISPPDARLAAELGLPQKVSPRNDRNVITAFGKVGKFFWQQMTRIR